MLRTTLIIASLTLIQGAAGQISSGGGGVRQEGQAVQAAGHHAIQVLSRQVTRAQAPGRNCTEAIPENKFLTTDKEVYLRFTYSGGAAGDLAAVEWVNPKKSVYLAQPFTNSGSGSICHAWFIGIAGFAAASQPGQWSVRLRWNDAILFEESFGIGNPEASSLNIVSNGVLPSGTTGAEYNYSFTTTGGKEPVVWSLESGSLPAGLRIASSGRISGTPTSPGSSRFTLKASDATGAGVTRTFAMGVSTADLIITPRSLLFSRAANGDRPAPQTIAINSTGAQIDYTVVVEGAPWLTATPGTGTTSGTVAVSIDATGRDQGSYSGNIRVRSASASVNAIIPVRLIVEDLDKPTVTRALISTVVGNDWIFPPEGVSRKAPLSKTVYMAADGAGNLYAADALSHVIVKMMPNGSYETIAGNSFPGLDSGDGGPGRNASLNTPCGIAVDTAGNVYFGDKNNHRIRRITPAGIISTYAGTGRAGSSGDDGPAVSATLNFPCHLALDNSGALYFYDERGFRIRRVSPDGRISTIAGNGKNEWGPYGPAVGAGVREVSGLAVSGDGTVYVSSLASNHIRRIKDGRLEIFAGTGENKFGGDGEPALNASFSRPEGLAVNSAGELFVCDRESSRVRKIDSGGKVSTIAGSRYDLGGDNGPASEALFRLPFSLASAADGSIYVMDNGSLTIRRIDAKSTVTWVAGDGFFRHAQDGTAARDSFLLTPMGVAIDRNGVMYVADAGSSRVRRIDADGLLQTIAGIGVEDYRASDNIPARRAFLNSPAGIAVDAAGNVYIADSFNNRIRRIDTKDNITTWAGDGGNDASGDGGPAAKASLYTPQGILFDARGNLLIADLRNYRIRKVSPDGSEIVTIAGNGRALHSGDGGPAITAGLREPFAIAVDSKENIYIADGIGHRVRKISKGGTISTFSGNGTAGSTGDGGPVSAATVNYPTSVAVDSADNVYIGERGGSRVRRVDAITEIITTIAGTGTQDFSGDGGLGVNASLKAPSIGLTVDSSGSLYIADTGNHRIRKVSAVQAKIAAAPNAVTFTGTGSLIHRLELTSDIAGGMPFTATAQFESGGEWLNLSTGNGSFPSALNITANRSGLAAGTYKATVLISAPGAQPPQLRVPVTLVVGESEQPQLKIESSPITLSLFEGAAPYTQLIRITNPSSVPVNVTLAAEGGSWLTLDSQGGRVSAAEPLVVTMTIDPAQLTTGTFQGSLIASGTASGKSIADRVPVVTVVKKSQKVILLSQTGLSYFAVAGGGAPLPHSISIANVGVGAMDWTATVVSQTGGNWLKIGSNSGSVQTPFVDASDLTVNADTSNLQPGEYYARIDVRAPGADNSPQTMTAVLNVYPAGTSLGPEVRPTSLFFVGGPGLQPAAKSVLVGNTSASVISYESTGQTFDQAPWLSYAPARAAVAPGKPAEIQVQPNLSSLSPGIRDGKVTLRFSDQSTFEINVTSIVSPTPVDIKTGRSAAKICSGKNLRLLPTSLGHTVRGTAGQPVSVEAVVVDDSGPFTKERCNASVSLAVVHENVRVTLDSHSNGKWTKSWTPKKSTSPTRVTGYITAFAMGPNNRPIADQFPITIEVGATGRTPQVASGKVLNSASSVPDSTSAPGTLISAPGTLISIYGNNLAAAIPAIADSVPHPIVLAETRVTLGGRDLPLGFASNGQVNAQVPYDLPANTVHQLLVFRPDATSGAEEITIAPSQPAVFTVNEQGYGQAKVNNTATNVAADTAHPVRAGDAIVIYCTGLGRVDPAVPEGSAAPSNPASQAINPVTVTIGGVEAKVNFAGLAPGFVGVSQVNAIVPAGTQLGNEVPLILTVGGQVSPVVTIAVR